MRDLIVLDTSAVMTCDPSLGEGRLGLIERGAVYVREGVVAWVGPERDLPQADGAVRLSAEGGLVTPGLVDAHAHPIFGGDRAAEFALRAEGKTYLDIARNGGGIMSTVRATRGAIDEDLVERTHERLSRALAQGTTTLEAKTGYALSVYGELRLLQLLAQVARATPLTIVPTLLGAHAVPAERNGDRALFVAECAGPMLEGARGLAHAVDVYCDEGAFTLEEARTILTAAKTSGFAVRAHAGQFRDLGAAGLVAELDGLSADHLEQVSDEQAHLMAQHGTVATLLPGACVQLRLTPPPVARLRDAGCMMALGTDMNPGSSMTESLPLQMWLAMTHLGMTVDEAWLGVTRHAARAAGRPEAGRIAPSAPADLVGWRTPDPAHVPYHYGENHVRGVIVAGTQVVSR
ncbi:MAG: imidazolonepropionase [Deltaproteobacteria bacterium]|nr:imidazolonepropionase [Deltaproteobacteria bacterium]